jgi:hypothetical protein
MCVKNGTEKCEKPEQNQPCGWCVMVHCPQVKKGAN